MENKLFNNCGNIFVNKECINAIKEINSKSVVSNEDLLTLKTYGKDGYSEMDVDTLIRTIDPSILEILNSTFDKERDRAGVMRWIKRGLRPELAIRHKIVNGGQKSKPLKFKNKNIIMKKDAIDETVLNKNTKDTIVLSAISTGISRDDEVVQLVITNLSGNVLYSNYFYPEKELSKEMAASTGLTRKSLEGSVSWSQEWIKIANILKYKKILVHFAEFDIRIIEQTCSRYGINFKVSAEVYCTVEAINRKYSYKSLERVAIVRKIVDYKSYEAESICKMIISCLTDDMSINNEDTNVWGQFDQGNCNQEVSQISDSDTANVWGQFDQGNCNQEVSQISDSDTANIWVQWS